MREVISTEELKVNQEFRFANSDVLFELNDKTPLSLLVTIKNSDSSGKKMQIHRSFTQNDLVIVNDNQ